MILHIDTTQNNLIEIGIKDKKKFIARERFESDHSQAEKLLPGIVVLLRNKKLKLSDLKEIKIVNRGGSFTSLRIGVTTANALGYALGIPVAGENGKARAVSSGNKNFNVVEPLYDREPVITEKKSGILWQIDRFRGRRCGKDVYN